MSEDNKKFYFSVIPKEEVSSFLTKAAEENFTMEIWQKGQNKDKIETFQIESFDSTTMTTQVKFNAGLLGKLTGSGNKDKDVLIKVSFGSIYIFTNSKLFQDGELYKVSFNQDVYKSQQRSNYRLNASRYVKIQFKIGGQVYEALDISAGGTSFCIKPEEEHKFKKEEIFEGCKVRLERSNFEIPETKVAGIWPHEFEDEQGNVTLGYKIGVSFIDLPKDIEEDLFLQINTEARGVELRKQGLLK